MFIRLPVPLPQLINIRTSQNLISSFHSSSLLPKSQLSRTLTTMSPTKYAAVIIGSGQAGTPLAAAYAKAGHKTALIERTHIGGTCVNEGCTPTKTMVASGRAAYLARRAADYGVHTPGGVDGVVSIDMLKVRQRKRDIVASFRGGNEGRVATAGVDVLKGSAAFTGPKTVAVALEDGSTVEVEGDAIFINVGERPALPTLPGLETLDPARVLDSTSIMELDAVPEHLLVLGGGYVGLEFAQLFRRLGAEVSVVQRGKQLLAREDAELAAEMEKILKEDGVDIHLNTAAVAISSSPAKLLSLSCRSSSFSSASSSVTELGAAGGGGGDLALFGSHILLATGRAPNTDSLNVAAAGIATTPRGYIVTNERLETSVPGVYALGDVKGPPAFTHISYDDFRIVQANVLTGLSMSAAEKETFVPLTITDRLVPYVVYTDPQLGHVGLHEWEAREKFPGRKLKTAKMPMAYVARALETDESRGMMKATVDAETGEILGFSCLGIEGGEVMSIVQMAMMGGVRYQKLQSAVFAHPALAESLNNLWGFLE